MWWWRFRRILARRHWLVATAAGMVLLLVGGAFLLTSGRGRGPIPSAPAAGVTAEPAAAPSVLVYVSGAVAHPGLYRLTASARVAEALAAAGGITAGADPGRLPNGAARVHDGRQVNVPFRGTRSGTTSAKLDINTATLAELRALPDMPPGLADAIVEARASWGEFASVGELRDTLGVDRATVAALSRELRVGPRR